MKYLQNVMEYFYYWVSLFVIFIDKKYLMNCFELLTNKIRNSWFVLLFFTLGNGFIKIKCMILVSLSSLSLYFRRRGHVDKNTFKKWYLQ